MKNKSLLFFASLASISVLAQEPLIPDFQVNENAGPNGAYQSSVSVCVNSIGNSVITWQDGRNGYGDIYAQRYSSNGQAIGTNFKVNNDEIGAAHGDPSVAIDDSGNFVIVWIRYYLKEEYIFAQRYSNYGEALGSHFVVKDAYGGYTRSPCISMSSSGNFVIAWHDGRDGDPNIYAQQYSSEGQPIGVNFKVNNDEGSAAQGYPAIAINDSGNYVIAWQDGRNGNSDIYAQSYSSIDTVLSPNFKVTDDVGDAWQYAPAITINSTGNYVIVWLDGRNGNGDIYAQRYSNADTALLVNFKINDDEGSTLQDYPSVAIDSSGNFVITWADFRYTDRNIFAQRFSNDGSVLGMNFKVNDNEITERGSHFYPSISMDSQGDFLIAWEDRVNEIGDICAQRYSNIGMVIGSNFKVNDDVGSAGQGSSSISTDNDGDFVIVWADGREVYNDIYAQRFSSNGLEIGTNFKVNDDDLGYAIFQYSPAISTHRDGNFVITWQDRRNLNYDIYAQRYSSNGNLLGVNFLVNDDEESATQENPSIATDDDGNYVITWQDQRQGRYYEYDIYAQRFSNTDSALSSNFRVNWIRSSTSSPSVTMNNNGNYVIVWLDGRNGNYDIYAQRYSNVDTAFSGNFKVNDDVGSAVQRNPAVASDSTGNFVVTWEDRRNGNYDIYAQMYSNIGNPIGSNFKVNDDEGDSDQNIPSIASNSTGNFVVTWEDRRNGNYDIYAQMYSNIGNPIRSNFKIINDLGYANQNSPEVRLLNNKIYNTWSDNRVGGTGCDVWANIIEWDFTVDIENNQPNQVVSYSLDQNYPNPFNPTTTIKYHLPKPAQIVLKIYNVKGQEVRSLVNNTQSVGEKSIVWDGLNNSGQEVSSGVYIYKLQTKDFTQSKKMLLLR